MPPLGYPPLCHRHWWVPCPAVVIAMGALIVVVAVGASPLPSSSLVPCPAVVVAVGAWWSIVAVGAFPLLLVAECAPPVVLMAVWCTPGRRHRVGAPRRRGSLPLILKAVCTPSLIVVAMGASTLVLVWCPTCPCGRWCPPAHPCGAPLGRWWPPIIVVAVSWPCGASLAVLAVCCLPQSLWLCCVPCWCSWSCGAPPWSSSWPCGAPLAVMAIGAPPACSSSWCPARPLVAPDHRGGRVVPPCGQ